MLPQPRLDLIEAFPLWRAKKRRMNPEDGGYWYKLEGTTLKGWLCPVLLEYFDEAPLKLYLNWKE